jgi:hypothetical protein
MNLVEVQVEGFRSIRAREVLHTDPAVTILIGANDHGKTNILSAIASLNDDQPFTDADRHWDLTDPALPAVQWRFALDDAERAALAEPPAEGKPPKGAAAPSQPPAEVIFARRGPGKPVEVIAPVNLSPPQVAALLKARPKIELCEAKPRISDEVTLAQLESPDFEFMKGLFIKAGLWDRRAEVFAQNLQTSLQLDEASAHLTRVLQAEWEQGRDLAWKFQHAAGGKDPVIQLLIRDPAVGRTYVRASQRSAGFTAFFILSLAVFARTISDPARSRLYLFDEPGTYLHPVGQVNLQRVFENLAQRAQIIYTTHSVFLVNRNVPSRNRVVRKTSAGTTIDRAPFLRNWKSLRESLGLMMGHNFLVSDRTLLLCGPSDQVLLLSGLGYLIRSGLVDIDLNGFSIASAGDPGNLVSMAGIMLAEGRFVTAMLDGDLAGDDLERDLAGAFTEALSRGDLRILRLPGGQSLEDAAPGRDMLFEAVEEVARDTVRREGPRASPGVDLPQMMVGIRAAAEASGQAATLARLIDDATRHLFRPPRSLSKLEIATRYEDKLRDAAPGSLADSATMQAVAQDLAAAVSLKPRRAAPAIVEELPA